MRYLILIILQIQRCRDLNISDRDLRYVIQQGPEGIVLDCNPTSILGCVGLTTHHGLSGACIIVGRAQRQTVSPGLEKDSKQGRIEDV